MPFEERTMQRIIKEIEQEIYKPLSQSEPYYTLSQYRNGLRKALRIIRQHIPGSGVIQSSEGEKKRCSVCGWPIVPEGQPGCWESNCSMRPMPTKPAAPGQAAAPAITAGVMGKCRIALEAQLASRANTTFPDDSPVWEANRLAEEALALLAGKDAGKV
jgi:hypothetical protein